MNILHGLLRLKFREGIKGKIKPVSYIWNLFKEMTVAFVYMNIIAKEECIYSEKRRLIIKPDSTFLV